MKVELTQEKKKFEPIELKITLETQEEFNNLYNRLSVGNSWIKRGSVNGLLPCQGNEANRLWTHLVNVLVNN